MTIDSLDVLFFAPGEVFVGPGEVSGSEGSNDREFTAEDEASGDFGEGPGFVGTNEVHELEAGVLGGESGASADSADHNAGKGDSCIEIAIGIFFESGDAYGGFGNAGDVLSGGEVEGGEAVGELALDSDGSAEDAADGGGSPIVAHVIDGAVEAFLNEVSGEGDFGRDLLAPGGREGAGTGFFCRRRGWLRRRPWRVRRESDRRCDRRQPGWRW